MKVFLDATPIYDHPAGIAVYVLKLLGEYAEMPDRVRAFVGHATVRPAAFRRFEEVLSSHELSVPFSRIWLPGRIAARFPGLARLLARPRLPTGGIDVFHATGNTVPRWFPVMGSKVVITVHDLGFLRHRGAGYAPEGAETDTVAALARASRSAAAVIADSSFTKSEVVDLLGVEPEKIFVVPLAPQWRGEAPGEGEMAETLRRYGLRRDRFFLSVGTLQPRKNFSSLLDAFAVFHHHHADSKLVIVGHEGWRAGDLARRLRARPPGVLWIEGCAEPQLRALYTAARGFFLLSWYEGFGLPVLEAMSSGCPVCYATGSSMDEVAGGASVPLRPDDVQGAADVMRRFWEDDDFAAAQSEAGLARAAGFSWRRTAEMTLDVYRAAMGLAQ